MLSEKLTLCIVNGKETVIFEFMSGLILYRDGNISLEKDNYLVFLIVI